MTTGGDLSRYMRQLLCAGETTSIADIYKLMSDRGFRHVPVSNSQSEAVGMISDRDILKIATFVNGQIKLPNILAKDLMSKSPVCVSPTTPLSVVASTMLSNRIDSVLITENKKIKGIITATDILLLCSESQLLAPLPKAKTS